ncbi:MAG TPA: DUF2567 domain-containing protein [Mycobacterium sp.]|uniref:DUF2567 domain-containing protein n=1 Tax=Mycobacterium sp. TaxID=1785 RepID=UPI002D43F8D1|nr:DUF2567 domain-containing protein [Mycobacterium sp.]HZU46137.1 DUF2567 domain-containing protein [Mycobacterium sp.]
MTDPRPCDAPRTSRRRAIAVAVSGLVATGVVIGGLWSWIAPSIHGVVALTHEGDRVLDYLGNEADHFFVAAFLMLGLLTVVAVVAAVLVWQWQAHRGPAMVAGLSIGMVGAAAAATALGALLVHARYGVVDIDRAPVTPQHRVHYFTEAPPLFFGHGLLQIGCTLLLPAATAALVYALLVASATRDDLGGYPAVESPEAPTAVTTSSGGAGHDGSASCS